MKVLKKESTIDQATGEVLYEVTSHMDFYLYTPKGYLFMNNKPAVKMFQGAEWDKLSGDEKQKIMTLLPYLDDENRFMRKDRTNRPLAAKQVSDILQISLPRSYSFLKRVESLGIIRKTEGVYYANPTYMMRGSRLSKTTYMVFRDLLDPHIPDWVKGKYEEEAEE